MSPISLSSTNMQILQMEQHFVLKVPLAGSGCCLSRPSADAKITAVLTEQYVELIAC